MSVQPNNPVSQKIEQDLASSVLLQDFEIHQRVGTFPLLERIDLASDGIDDFDAASDSLE